MQKNNFFKNLWNDRGTRAIAITVCVMFLLLTAIIVTTVIANRATDRNSPINNPIDDIEAGVTNPDEEGNEPEPQPEKEPEPEKQDDQKKTSPTQFMLPVSGTLSQKHDEDTLVFSLTMDDYRTHTGIDISTIAGATVSAMEDGIITRVDDSEYYGTSVTIQHGDDIFVTYRNLSKDLPENVVEQARVKKGDKIGVVGETFEEELTQEPHLHLEFEQGGKSVNPLDFLSKESVATLLEDTNFEDAS